MSPREFTLFVLICLVALKASPQGQVVLDNRVPGTVIAPVYDFDFLNPTNAKYGNTSSGFPAGSQTYAAALVSGSSYSAQLFGGPTNASDADLSPLFPVVTFRTNASGFVVAPTNAVTVTGVSEGQRARLQLRAWDNGNGTVTNWQQVVSDATILRGQSASFISEPLGGLFIPPANLTGLQSFNLVTVVPPPFSARINFQPNAAPLPGGYVADTGVIYGNRGNGLSYGWNVNLTTNTVDQNMTNSPDQRYDTFVYMDKTPGAFWEIGVTNGVYRIHAVAGDPSAFDSVYRIEAEGRSLISGTPTSTNRWIQGETIVDVNDGRLTISSGDGAINNRLNFLEITKIEPSLLQPPVVNIVRGSGNLIAKYVVEHSTNLMEWLPVGTATNAGKNIFQVTQLQTNFPCKFYRARTVVNPLPTTVYSNNFELAAGTEWSTNLVSVTPTGNRHFLGPFGRSAVTLALTNLPAHTKATIAFDLYVIGSWDGNSSANGPDFWTMTLVNAQTLLNTTFQAATQNPNLRQAYPGDYPASFLPLTGARETGTLGFSDDSVYRISSSFNHSNGTLELLFSGGTTESISAESWGIDNIVVTVRDDAY